MATINKNLSDFSINTPVSISDKKFGLIVSEWNQEITGPLFQGAKETLLKYGAIETNIIRESVPGSFELSLGAQWMAQKNEIDAVICLGCVIQGETRHFDFICGAVANGLTQVALKFDKPVIFGVLTPNNQQQAMERAGGIHGNKGDEAAITAIKMLAFNR